MDRTDLNLSEESTRYNSLRDKWHEFIYHSYHVTTTEHKLKVQYHFSIPGLSEFRPTLEFRLTPGAIIRSESETADRLLFNIGMIELISYWKSTCSPVVRIECGSLTAEQLSFWKELYYNGLGEFFYRNNIPADPDSFMTIEAPEPEADELAELFDQREAAQTLREENDRRPTPRRMLVPVGGGKDSAVSLARLRQVREDIVCFSVNPIQAALDTMDVAGIPAERRVIVRRTLDPNMLELNRQGYWNGHTPFSALVAFISMYAAYLHDLSYIVLSNEASADESTIKGSTVNHQYSKTSTFEQLFQNYTDRWLGTGIYYFSFMRPFTELAIAREFTRHPEFFPVIRSCNVGSKENRWCGSCAKCLFVAIMFSPYLTPETVQHILAKDILDDRSLSTELEGLCGRIPLKPWECVGTVEEVNAALCDTIAWHHSEGCQVGDLPVLLQAYLRWVEAGEVPSVHLTEYRYPITVLNTARGLYEANPEDSRIPGHFWQFIEGMTEAVQ